MEPFALLELLWNLPLPSDCRSLTYLCDKTIQSASAVAAILNDTLCKLSIAYPNLRKAIIQADNAGCYHSFDMIVSSLILNLESTSKIRISRVLFSEVKQVLVVFTVYNEIIIIWSQDILIISWEFSPTVIEGCLDDRGGGLTGLE